MVTSFKFLLQASRVLSDQNYIDQDLELIYEFLTTVDNNELNEYYNSATIFSYRNDLELYVESVNKILNIFEDKEKYEKCYELKKKLDESREIIKNNKIKQHG
jgi:Na+/phosphate symporter